MITVSGQIVWNEPPDTIWYGNQSRWVEVILPTPQNLSASTVNTNQVKLTWNEYWTQALLDAYLNKFGYAAIPNRFSLYKQNITNGGTLDALTGVDWDKTEYIDTNVELGKEYLYKIMASDLNYQTRLQHWSPRSAPAIVTVGASLSSLSSPINFQCHYQPYPPMIAINGNISSDRTSTISVISGALDFNTPNNFSGYYEPDSAMIILTWDYVKDASSYIIYKSYVNPDDTTWVYLSIPISNTNKYFDSELLPYVGYVYDIIAVNGNIKSIRATNRLTINSGTLSMEEEEYWEAVDEYEKDRKIGWFGCGTN